MQNREVILESFIMRLFGEGDLAMFCGDEVKFLAKRALGIPQGDPTSQYEDFLDRISTRSERGMGA